VHILIFNEYYPPDTSATAKMASLVAEELAKSHRVTVIAGRPSYDPDERYAWSLLRRDVRNGVTVERVGSTTYSRHGMRGRVSNYLSYLALAVPRALFKRSDIILAMTDPPVAGIAGAFIARLSERAFVYNIRDLYPDMAIGGEIVPANAWARRWESLHRRALRHATRVIVLGEDMRERILQKGVAPDRVTVIRDGAQLPESLAAQSNPIAQEIRCGFPFVAIHAGNLGFYGAWDTLLRAMKLLEEDDSGLVFVGEGANRDRLQQAARESTNVRLLPFRPAAEIPYVMAAGDVHIVTVLAVAPEECDAVRIVRSAQCGLAADPDDPVAVAAALRKLRSDPALLEDMGRRARETAKKYARADELKRFVGVVEEAARNGTNR
jgi:glycosyltransferase involved in cell wall biosynthesis